MINSFSEWKDILTGEFLLLGLISRLFYKYPDDQEWYRSLFTDDVFLEVPFAADQDQTKMGLELMQKWGKQGITDESFEELKVDYTRLFIGVGKVPVPPYESVYFSEERLVFQERTLEVRAWYKRFGLEAEKKHKEPDDHIGLEFLFLANLASMGMEALEKEDQPRFNELLDAQREFLMIHPGAWGLTFCDLVASNAQTDFYSGLAFLTRGALTALSDMLDVKLTKDTSLGKTANRESGQ